MPAYNFKRRFAKMVESGQKTQTIRKIRKYPTKPGQIAYLNTGMRTKNFRRLGFGTILDVNDIKIVNDRRVVIDGVVFTDQELFYALAKADGFSSWDAFVWFFETHYGLPFKGEIIKWRLLDGEQKNHRPNSR